MRVSPLDLMDPDLMDQLDLGLQDPDLLDLDLMDPDQTYRVTSTDLWNRAPQRYLAWRGPRRPDPGSPRPSPGR